MNLIETGETFQAELRSAGIGIQIQLVNKIIEVLRAHDASKRNLVPVPNLQLRVELARRTVAADCLATSMGIPAGMNLYTAVDTMVANSGDIPMQLRWGAPTMHHDDPMVVQMGALFGYDATALADLFIAARG